MVGYAFQLFADFAGYSFIALGLGELFGYKLIRNFNYPYISTTFSEYWKRWHITLYDWFNYYVYNPFTFARRYWGVWSVVLGVILVFGLSGIWHGASWNFGVWGLMHGAILLLEMYVFSKLPIKQNLPVRIFRMLLVFGFVVTSYIFFRFENMDHVWYLFQTIYTNWGFHFSSLRLETYTILYGLPILIYHLSHFLNDEFKAKRIEPIKPIVYGLMIVAIILDMGSAKEFIYFQF